MKYADILELNPNFQPAVDLTNEVGDYWKRFIPNDKFYEVLKRTLNALESQRIDERKSLWLQGDYGTGKSHATAVIKHLFYDPVEEISDFVNNCFTDKQLKQELFSFRKKSKAFPVVLKGISNITDNKTFGFAIQKAVKNTLALAGHSIAVKSDFEEMIFLIENDTLQISWDELINKHQQIKMFAPKRQKLIERLRNNDLELLRNLEEVLAQNNLQISTNSIDQWLKQIITEIREKRIAESLVIFWDEFTHILEMQNSSVLINKLQDIADLSANNTVYLFVVSHRRPDRTRISKEDFEHIMDRFITLDYSMEQITTYHLIGASILKSNKELWGNQRDENLNKTDKLLKKIADYEGQKAHSLVRDLFPIHPYTAYLTTFLAKNIGSTERSIFSFLYSKEKGFMDFIKANPDNDKNLFLTPNYIWDFFAGEFERMEDVKYLSVLNRYKLHCKTVEEKGKPYTVIFKSVLLLNVLYNKIDIQYAKDSLIPPKYEHIQLMFAGTEYEKQVDEVLDWFDKAQIISRDPNNLFVVSSSTLPYAEVEKEKQNQSSIYKEIDKILTAEQISQLERNVINPSAVLRKAEFKVFDASWNKNLIISRLSKAFSESYSLHVAMFLARSYQDLEQVKKNIAELVKENNFRTLIFIVAEEILEKDIYDKFITYKAYSIVADKHKYDEEKRLNEDYAVKIIDKWIVQLSNTSLKWYLNTENGSELMNNLCIKINDNFSAKIYEYGLENLKGAKNTTIWTVQKSKSGVDIFVLADSLNYIESKTEKGRERYLREIIRDDKGNYLVDNNLVLQSTDSFHPIVKMSNEIEKKINEKKQHIHFNLGELLKFLSEPPFGLYENMINMSAMGFLMNKYVGKFYEESTGKPIEKEIMRDKILHLFEYWSKDKDHDKLNVRLGTKEEKELLKVLKTIFHLDTTESLNKVRWSIREWGKQCDFPIWVFKYDDNSNDTIKIAIDNIFQFINSIDVEITTENIIKLFNQLEPIKDDLGILIFKQKNGRNLFITWLNSIEGIESINKPDEIIIFIQQSFQEEKVWDENKVREKVKDWYNDYLRKQLEEERKKTEESNSEPQPKEEPKTKKQIKEFEKRKIFFAQRIDKVTDINHFRNRLKRIADDNPDLLEILEKYLFEDKEQ